MTTLLSIFIAGVISMAIGFAWYHPKVFGTKWMRLSGISPDQASSKERMLWVTIVGFLNTLLVATMLHFQLFSETDTLRALAHSGWLWLGFMAPVMLGSVLWERKPVALYVINVGYWLVVMLSMAAVLSLIA